MKSLHIDTGRDMRGGQWQVLYLLEGMAGATLLARRESPLFLEAARRGIDVRPLSYRELRSEAGKFDLVHAHDARAHSMAAVMSRTPLIVSRRVGFAVRSSVLSKWKYAKAARYLAVSHFVAARLNEAGVPAARIRVVYDGVPLPPSGEPIRGRVVGLRSKAAELPGIPIHWSEDLWRDLACASVFVYASQLEGLGSAALAAMACGVPVAASGAGGLAEVVEHEVTGLLVEPAHLGAAVQQLLADPDRAAQMGMKGRKRVMERFSVEAMRVATVRAYEELTQ